MKSAVSRLVIVPRGATFLKLMFPQAMLAMLTSASSQSAIREKEKGKARAKEKVRHLHHQPAGA